MSNQFKILRNQAFKDLFTGLVNLNEETVLQYAEDQIYFDRSQLSQSLPSGTVPEFPELKYDNSKTVAENERINSPLFYDKISDQMNFVKAKQERFWASTCHLHYFKYIKNRIRFNNKWLGENNFNKLIKSFPNSSIDDKNKIVDLIIGNFFVRRGSTRSMVRNPISRLWLAPELTFSCWKRSDVLKELKNDDPYYYTKILLDTNIYQNLIERPQEIGQRFELLNMLLYFFSLDPKRITKKWYTDFVKILKCTNVVNPVFLNRSFKDYIIVFEEIEGELSV